MIYKGQSKKMLYRYKIINGNLVQAIKTYRGDKLVYQLGEASKFTVSPTDIILDATTTIQGQIILDGPNKTNWSVKIES